MANTNTAKKSVENVEEAVQMTLVKNNEELHPATVLEPAQALALAPEPELTLEQKINKVEDLTMVIDKWRKLIDSRTNVPKEYFLKLIARSIRAGPSQPSPDSHRG
jgi:hypothetical protein